MRPPLDVHTGVDDLRDLLTRTFQPGAFDDPDVTHVEGDFRGLGVRVVEA